MKHTETSSNSSITREYALYLSKIIVNKDAPYKEKHLRKIILNSYKDSNSIHFYIAFNEIINNPYVIVRWKMLIVLHTFVRDSSFHKNVFDYIEKMISILPRLNNSNTCYDSLCEQYTSLLIDKVTFCSRMKFIKGNYVPIDKTILYPFKSTISGIQYVIELSKHLEIYVIFSKRILNVCSKYGENASIDQTSQVKLQAIIPSFQDCEALVNLIEISMDYLAKTSTLTEYSKAQEVYESVYNKYYIIVQIISKIYFISIWITIPNIREKCLTYEQRRGDKQVNQVNEPLIQTKPKSSSEQISPTKPISPNLDKNISNEDFRYIIPKQLNSKEIISPSGASSIDKLFDNETVPLQHSTIPQISLSETNLNLNNEKDNIIKELNVRLSEALCKYQQLENDLNTEKQSSTNNIELIQKGCDETVRILESKNKDLQNQLLTERNNLKEYKPFEEKFNKLKDIYGRLRGELKAKEDNLGAYSNKEQQIKAEFEEKKIEFEDQIDKMKYQIELCEKDKLGALEKVKELNLLNSELTAKIEILEESKATSLLKFKESFVDFINKFLEELLRSIAYSLKKLENIDYGNMHKSDFLTILIAYKESYKDLIEFLPEFNYSLNMNHYMEKLMGLTIYRIILQIYGQRFTTAMDSDSEDIQRNLLKSIEKYSELIEILKKKNYIQSQLDENYSHMVEMINSLEKKVINYQKQQLEEEPSYDFNAEINSAMNQVDEAATRIQNTIKMNSENNSFYIVPENRKLLNNCSEFLDLIKKLIMDTQILQNELVKANESNDPESKKNIYKKNNKWTEGLVSASKSIGKGAIDLVSIADDVLSKESTIEELIVSLNGLTAGTIQLVTASKVKAKRDSSCLHAVLKDSTDVRNSAANIVAFCRSEFSDKPDSIKYDFSKLSATKAKTIEAEIQIRVLELENTLSKEHEKLRRIREAAYK